MATEQVLNWINNDLTLSQSVANFETDFSNGYLLGEILASYSQADLKLFSRKKNKEAKVNNFYLIENALRKLNVRFDGKLIHQIMEEERGASLRLLYQVKLSCQRLGVKTAGDAPTMTNLPTDKMHTILKNKQEATMEMSKTIPPPTVGGKDIRTAKQARADRRTLGYDVAQKQLFDSAQAAHDAEMELIKSITQNQRNSNMTKLIENQTFMKEWHKEGMQNWKTNQKKRTEAIEKVKYFEDREVNIYKSKLNNELVAATTEQVSGISDFEKNLQKLGIQQGISMDEAIKKQEEKKGIPPGQIQNFSYAATMNKIKETKKNSDFAGKERDRRRRKMIVDQQNAQTKLDQEASEEALITKLLQQTSDEHKDAFIDIRMGKCKQNDFQMRKNVALTQEEKRRVANEAAEVKRQASVKEVEAERSRQNQVRRQETKKVAFEKKMEKRSVNIEIASGLVDLILDMADETFDVVSASETHQIPNPMWRDFVSIFKSGKKVSLRNVANAPVAADSQQSFDSLHFPQDILAHDLQKQFWSEPAMLNFYEYLSGSGQFNIPQLQPDLWHRYQDQYEAAAQDQQQETSPQVPFIDIKLQENGELVHLLDSLYKQTLITSQTDLTKDQGCQLLMQPTIKLALVGRAFSGKKTVASQIKEMLGADVSVLHMDEIIKEAIEYISPKKQDDSVVIDPKAKNKKKEEPVVTDIFEGKNTLQYKSIAQQIKDAYFAGETLPRNVDLADLVLDDTLLNGLVIERLKLLCEGKTTKGAEQIKAGVAREREIVKQLEELEAIAAQAAADPKAKAAKPAKGQPNPETLNAELTEIRSFKASGWILIGYPKQLSQIKLLEQELTGFVSKIDQPKSERIEIQESWNKLVLDDKDNCEKTAPTQQTVASGFDSVIFLETPESECLRRCEGMTEDERGNEQRIQGFNEIYNGKVGSVKKWCEQFGLVDPQGCCKVTLNQEVNSAEWDKKDVVKDSAIACVKKVMAFKQAQFDVQRESFRQELAQQSLEANESQKDASATPAPEGSNMNSTMKDKEILNDTSGMLPPPSIDEGSALQKKKSIAGDKSSMDGATTIKSSRRTKQNQQRYEINETQKVNCWEDMLNSYYRDSLQYFNDLVKQRQRIFGLFAQTQTNFVNYICREAPYQRRVNDFCENFNRFSEQYPELRGKEETRTELLKRVSMLNDSLWQTILERKTQAVEEREAQYELMQQGWESREKSKLVSLTAQLMEQEFERFRTVVSVVTGWVANQDIDLFGLCQRLDERATSTFEFNQEGQPVSPMLEQVVTYLHGTISQLMQEPFVQQSAAQIQTVLLKERANFHLRCNTLKSYAMLLLVEINQNTEMITEAFEEWIITSVKKENSVAANVIKTLKAAVQNDASYLDNIKVQHSELEQSIQRVELDEGKPLYVAQASTQGQGMAETRLEIETLGCIYNQLKCQAIEELLDSQTFISIVVGNYQSYRVPQRWRNLSFQAMLDLVQKFDAKPLANDADSGRNPFAQHSSVSDDRSQFVNWQKIFILFSLASSKIPSDERLQTYGAELAYYGSSISLEDFQNADAWFDTTESANTASQMIQAAATKDASIDNQDEEVFDQVRLKELKRLLWLTVKRTNEQGIRAQDLVNTIKEIKAMCQGDEQTFGDILSQ